MNFVVENSNKLSKNGFRRENELNVFTLGANNTHYVIYPWWKVICFVLFCFNDISQTMMFYIMLWNLLLKSSQWVRVHWLGLECLKLWCGIFWLLDHFFIDWFSKTKIENYIQIWKHSWYCWKALTKFDLIKLIS